MTKTCYSAEQKDRATLQLRQALELFNKVHQVDTHLAWRIELDIAALIAKEADKQKTAS